MCVRVSIPFVLVLILLGFSVSGWQAFAFDKTPMTVQDAMERKSDRAENFKLVFHGGSGEMFPALEKGGLLGANSSFATPACSRLKITAERSGETYAGHLLRERMRIGACARFLASGGKVWDWPWKRGMPRMDLPPHERGQFGAWQVRCEDQSETRRCALVQIVKADGEGAPEIITHFTVTRFHQQLVPVWRVFALRNRENWYSGMTAQDAKDWEKMVSRCVRRRQAFSKCMRGARDRFKARRTSEIGISLGRSHRNLNFTKCIASGCMTEAPLEFGVQAYRELDNGRSVLLKLHPVGDMPVRFQVRPEGFAEALAAFSNIDRKHISVQAGRDSGAL